ncbi:MAG: cytochrome-c oxidase, cbb3-type subunit III [Aquisalinus sp.]|nr:cytochrome-c oxidase, cbb3-type subunit III [Aquisalinus sp.]
MTSSDEKDIDEVSGIDTTGHEWDGIKELNNPLPRWWLILFYVTVFWSVVYWVFMPSWPGISGHLKGTRNHSERENVELALNELQAFRAENAQRLLSARSLSDIEQDPQLLQFAMASGASAFGDNCATCHGVGGGGFRGYPNLNDDVWLWGGTLDDIKQTIRFGIRSEHPEARISIMPAFGEQGILNSAQISDMVDYVEHLAGRDSDMEAVARIEPVYQAQCSACHGAAGLGDRAQGAPNLTDAEWLFGDDRAAIRDTIYYARNAVMPHWNERLDEPTIAALSVYVHTLGGGE